MAKHNQGEKEEKMGALHPGVSRSGLSRPNAPSPEALALWNLIASLSRVSACIATNETLAKKLGRSPRTVRRRLRWLEDNGLIIRVRKVPNEYLPREGDEEKLHRVFYLVAHRKPEVGALQLAHLIAQWNNRDAALDNYCGRLQCTPKQFARWLRLAVKNGWVSRHTSEEGVRSIEANPDLPPVKLPEAFSVFSLRKGKPTSITTLKPLPEDPVRDALTKILDGQLKVKVAVALTDNELRSHPLMPSRASRSNVQQKLRELIEERRYFRYSMPKGFGKGRLICGGPTTAQALAVYAATLLPGRVRRQTRRRRGRPRTAGPRLRVRDVQRRLALLASASGSAISKTKVTKQIASALKALGMTGPRDATEALELVASHLLEGRLPSPPMPTWAPSPATTATSLIDMDQLKSLLGIQTGTDPHPPEPPDAVGTNQPPAEEAEASGVTESPPTARSGSSTRPWEPS